MVLLLRGSFNNIPTEKPEGSYLFISVSSHRRTNLHQLEINSCKWVNHAHLFGVKSIDGQSADLLKKAGVVSVLEPAMREPDALTTKKIQVNEKKNLVNRPPSEKEVAKYSRSGAKEVNSICLLIRHRQKIRQAYFQKDSPLAFPPWAAQMLSSSPAATRHFDKPSDRPRHHTLK